jgi:hypothetical protein
MARIRTIKPDFWKHEELSELAPEVHMLAAALLNYADDEGYFRANPKLVKAECCPLREDSVSVHEALKQLADIGYVRLFTGSDHKEYGKVVNFVEHQRINRPTPSKIKELDTLTESSVTDHGAVNDGSPPEGKGREQGKERNNEGASAPFEVDWDSDPQLFARGKAILGNKAGGQVKRLKDAFGSVYNARRVIEAAAQKQNPVEYVEAARHNELERQHRKREPTLNQIAAG